MLTLQQQTSHRHNSLDLVAKRILINTMRSERLPSEESVFFFGTLGDHPKPANGYHLKTGQRE
jgi:hypothetical protein